MKLTVPAGDIERITGQLKKANAHFTSIYPGEKPDRQPVHTVYGGAHLFRFDTSSVLGERALFALETYAPDPASFGEIFGFPKIGDRSGSSSEEIYEKVIRKLKNEPVEDFRIDFEDGFGIRPADEEDEAALRTAEETARGLKEGTLPPSIGIRIKPFTEEMKARGLRTLDLYLTRLLSVTGGVLPDHFVIMLPKVTIAAQVTGLVEFLDIFEKRSGLRKGIFKMEMMVETTQALMDHTGRNPLLDLVRASKGRCQAVHFGTYDYTASNHITAMNQKMDHTVCDFAHYMTKIALTGTGIWLSDGATNVLPVGPHRDPDLTAVQFAENTEVVRRAWRMAYNQIRHSLWKGLYQGWDLHPAQLPVRYAAVYAFFLEGLEDAIFRLRSFLDQSAKASLAGDVFDDAATGQGLINYFVRALNSGALDEGTIEQTGLTIEQLRMRSFAEILKNRQ